MSKAPKIFISYSHDSQVHKDWVAELADRLDKSGIEVILDQSHLRPGANIDQFMEESVKTSNRVLIICTSEYIKKANTGKGGSGSEAIIAAEELKRNPGTNKFISIIRKIGGKVKTPKFLNRHLDIDFSNDAEYESNLRKLIQEIYLGFEKPAGDKKKTPSFGKLLITPVVNIARAKVHKLIAFWFQLILTNFIIFATTTFLTGYVIGIFSILLMFPFSIIISRLVNKDFVMSILMGGIILGVLEGGLAYLISKSAVVDGLLFGMFYGASLTNYFSAEDKYTDLWRAAVNTLLIVSLCAFSCAVPYGIAICVDVVGDFSLSLRGALVTILAGFGFSPLIPRLNDLMQSFIDEHIFSD